MALPPEEKTYYEQWGPIERRVRFWFNWLSMFWAKKVTILVEINWRLGDEIMALPIYQTLKETFDQEPSFKKEVCLVVWCNYPELLEHNPYVDAINSRDIRPHTYSNLRTADRNVNRSACLRRAIGQNPKSATDLLPRPKLYYTDWSTPLLDEIPIGDGPVVALCRGASWATKRWTVERWDDLGRALESRGYRVIVLGQAGEEIPVGTDFTGRTGVREAACLLHRADVTISNDSGLMHLSLAADTETIGLFGPTDPAILIEGDARFQPLTNQRECQGCWNRDLSIQEPGVCPKGIADCMETIPVEDVLVEVDRILGAAK